MPIRAFVVVLPMLISLLAGCGPPPTAEADAARQSMASASSAGADKYAAASLKEAQAADAALDAELKAQEGKFIKSYDRARELAVAAKTAADKAATEATSARELAEAEEARKAKAAAVRREKLAKAVRVGGQIRPPIRIKEVAPLYPAIAQSARVQGDVVIEATIDEEGKVADARVVKSVPLLYQAELDAVRQWEYRPSLLKGVPTAMVTTVPSNSSPVKWVDESWRIPMTKVVLALSALWLLAATSLAALLTGIFRMNRRKVEAQRQHHETSNLLRVVDPYVLRFERVVDAAMRNEVPREWR